DLLGITHGAVALTKIDRVSTERRDHVAAEIRALFAGTTLEDSPVFPLSALTGDGVPALRTHLDQAAGTSTARSSDGNFRLAIDRCFNVAGSGIIVTGTAFSGRIETGDTARLLSRDLGLRVRGIHAQNAESRTGAAGQRCALNITGPDLAKDMIERGDWIVGDGAPGPVLKFDAELCVLASEERPLAHWTPVHVHLGAAETPGRVAILDAKSIAPGAIALAQLVLDRPIGAAHSDRFIIRDQSARRTIGGGGVLDIHPPRRGRARPERLAWLNLQCEADPAIALAELAAQVPAGVDAEAFRVNRNIKHGEFEKLLAQTTGHVLEATGSTRVFSKDNWELLARSARERLAQWHAANPGADGLPAAQILAHHRPALAPELQSAIADALVANGAFVRAGNGVALPGHQARLTGPDQALWDRVRPALDAAAPRPMTLTEIGTAIGMEPRRIEPFLGRAGRHRLVARISKTRFTSAANLAHLAAAAEKLARQKAEGTFSAAEYRDATGIGRNITIELLEFFDQQKFTHRNGDLRRVIVPAHEKFGAAAS
ncbi:MAG: SelB C-terminal domain-containing protein, partial [Hyphomicrobiaceae bacterium]|nr:SelB C-terminal domain-containing protein [Hyphomicrobiaceae bacterium]